MERRAYLQIPGPTNVPDRILRELSRPLIDHRGDEFAKLLTECLEGLGEILRTRNDILLYPSSGSGMLESAIVNLFSMGDTILTSSIGVFSERMGTIAERFGLNVTRIEKEWGSSLYPSDVREILENDKAHSIRAVCVPQNETSTGVTIDIEGISRTIKEVEHPAILVVDAISSLGCMALDTDAWGLDVVIASSQKGLMLPPGMGIVSIGRRAWEYCETGTLPKWYWDYRMAKERVIDKQFPYTPPVTLFFGLREALAILKEEGIENVWDRHELMARAVRNASKAMELELLPSDKDSSSTVTAIQLPKNIEYGVLAATLKGKYSVVVGGGLAKLQGRIFRIGHMGSIHHMDIYSIMGAVEMAMYELGYKVELGTAARAIAHTFAK